MCSKSTDCQWEFRFVYSMSPLIQAKGRQYDIKLGHYIGLSYSRSLARTGLSGLMGQPGTKLSTNPGPTTISVEEGNFEPSPMWSQCQWLQTTASDLSKESLVPNFDSSSPGYGKVSSYSAWTTQNQRPRVSLQLQIQPPCLENKP